MKNCAQEARNRLTIQKVTFATALISQGSIKLDPGVVNTTLLSYLAPWVAIVFDFYILGEDYSVKRLGAFLHAYSGETLGEMGGRTPRSLCALGYADSDHVNHGRSGAGSLEYAAGQCFGLVDRMGDRNPAGQLGNLFMVSPAAQEHLQKLAEN